MIGQCEFCGESVEARHAAYRVEGWEPERSEKGGANRIIGRERLPDRLAHIACAERAAERARRGIAPEQTTLV